MLKHFMVYDEYKSKNDDEIIEMIKKGDNDALNYLMSKYKELVNMKVSKYFIVGAEKDDIIQEGMIGLFKAVKNYNSSIEGSFKTFANMCIERQLITAIKTSNRQKHIPLNTSVSLNTSYDGDEDHDLLDRFNAGIAEDPLDTITKKEYYKQVETSIDSALSKFEKQVLERYINGESYVQIAEKLDLPVKSIDNAIQRIRKKAIKNINI